MSTMDRAKAIAAKRAVALAAPSEPTPVRVGDEKERLAALTAAYHATGYRKILDEKQRASETMRFAREYLAGNSTVRRSMVFELD